MSERQVIILDDSDVESESEQQIPTFTVTNIAFGSFLLLSHPMRWCVCNSQGAQFFFKRSETTISFFLKFTEIVSILYFEDSTRPACKSVVCILNNSMSDALDAFCQQHKFESSEYLSDERMGPSLVFQTDNHASMSLFIEFIKKNTVIDVLPDSVTCHNVFKAIRTVEDGKKQVRGHITLDEHQWVSELQTLSTDLAALQKTVARCESERLTLGDVLSLQDVNEENQLDGYITGGTVSFFLRYFAHLHSYFQRNTLLSACQKAQMVQGVKKKKGTIFSKIGSILPSFPACTVSLVNSASGATFRSGISDILLSSLLPQAVTVSTSFFPLFMRALERPVPKNTSLPHPFLQFTKWPQFRNVRDFFSHTFFLVPLHNPERHHWTLVVVKDLPLLSPYIDQKRVHAKTFNVDRASIFYLDSLRYRCDYAHFKVRRFVKYMHERVSTTSFNINGMCQTATVNPPQQTNSYDCGVYILVYALLCTFGMTFKRPGLRFMEPIKSSDQKFRSRYSTKWENWFDSTDDLGSNFRAILIDMASDLRLLSPSSSNIFDISTDNLSDLQKEPFATHMRRIVVFLKSIERSGEINSSEEKKRKPLSPSHELPKKEQCVKVMQSPCRTLCSSDDHVSKFIQMVSPQKKDEKKSSKKKVTGKKKGRRRLTQLFKFKSEL
ncbi:hypothetical protein PCE1_004158 [Barthelona sp. PCE]